MIHDLTQNAHLEKPAVATLGHGCGLSDFTGLAAQRALNHTGDKHLDTYTLRAFSNIDGLMGLANKKGLLHALSYDVERTNRGRSDGGLLVMFRLENLDLLCADHGPESVDHAVKLVANALRSEIRTMDLAARVNEDEFALLFTDTDMESIMSRLQTLSLQLNSLRFTHGGEDVRINLSLGFKSYTQGCNTKKIFSYAEVDLHHNRGLAGALVA